MHKTRGLKHRQRCHKHDLECRLRPSGQRFGARSTDCLPPEGRGGFYSGRRGPSTPIRWRGLAFLRERRLQNRPLSITDGFRTKFARKIRPRQDNFRPDLNLCAHCQPCRYCKGGNRPAASRDGRPQCPAGMPFPWVGLCMNSKRGITASGITVRMAKT